MVDFKSSHKQLEVIRETKSSGTGAQVFNSDVFVMSNTTFDDIDPAAISSRRTSINKKDKVYADYVKNADTKEKRNV